MTQLSANVSLESNKTGWTGVYDSASTVTRVEPAGGSYDGKWALRITPKAGSSGAAGVNNSSPLWVPGTPGETINLLVRETTPSGTSVGYHLTTATYTDKAWHLMTSKFKAKNTSDVMHYSLYASNFAGSSQNFLADCLSFQVPS